MVLHQPVKVHEVTAGRATHAHMKSVTERRVKAATVFIAPDGTAVPADRVRGAARKSSAGRVRTCNWCSGRFESKRQDAKYCSISCRQKAYRNRKALERKEVIVENRSCAHCGAGFFVEPWKSTRFCSVTCRRRAAACRRASAAAAIVELYNVSLAMAQDAIDERGMPFVTAQLHKRGFYYEDAARRWLPASGDNLPPGS